MIEPMQTPLFTHQQSCALCNQPAVAGYGSCLRHAAADQLTLPAQPERRQALPPELDYPPLNRLRHNADPTLYRHQVLALEQLLQGKNTVLSTTTASGKSLVFQLWVLHRLSRRPGRNTLVFYPSKALANDQERSWQQLGNRLGLTQVAGIINGDTPREQRAAILQNYPVVLITPDTAHAWLLQNAHRPVERRFLEDLDTLVIDEAHTYENAFGTNMAYLLRRLLEAAGRPLRMIAATATLPDPAAHLENLTGQPFCAVTPEQDGAPRQERQLYLLEPKHNRIPIDQQATDLLISILENDPAAQAILFHDSRQGVEKLIRQIAGRDAILPYRSGYLAEDRRQIEQYLRAGKLKAVITTSALELGIDMPDLNYGINLRLPESRKQLQQRLGRVGRQRPGQFIILDHPENLHRRAASLEEYYAQGPEPARLYLDNPWIARQHAWCLRWELAQAGKSNRQTPAENWPEQFEAAWNLAAHYPFPQRAAPHAYHPIRGSGGPELDLQLQHGASIGQTSVLQALQEAYPGALYRHQGRPYRVLSWKRNPEPERTTVQLQPAAAGAPATKPLLQQLLIIEQNPTQDLESRSSMGHALLFPRIEIHCSVEGFRIGKKEYPYRQLTERPDLRRRVLIYPTTGLLLHHPELQGEGLRRLARALIQTLAEDQGFDTGEMGYTGENIILSTPTGPRRIAGNIMIYDRTYGGLGLAKQLLEALPGYLPRLDRDLAIDLPPLQPWWAEMTYVGPAQFRPSAATDTLLTPEPGAPASWPDGHAEPVVSVTWDPETGLLLAGEKETRPAATATLGRLTNWKYWTPATGQERPVPSRSRLLVPARPS